MQIRIGPAERVMASSLAVVVAVSVMLTGGCACCSCKKKEGRTKDSKEVAYAAETALTQGAVPQVSPQEARARLAADDEVIYLDVRTVAEFEERRVPDAYNVPVFLHDADANAWHPNEDFVSVVKATVPKDAEVIVGCRSGKRSQRAVELMREAGYTRAVSLSGGFYGKRDAGVK